MKHQKTTIMSTVAVLIAITALLAPGYMTNTEAEEKEGYVYGNDVSVKTVFHFNGKPDETINFQTFDQVEGFKRSTESPQFKVSGVIDGDRPYLYDATDYTYVNSARTFTHQYSDFGVDVELVKGDVPVRTFSYDKCYLTDYKVETLYDKEEAWMGKGFVLVDVFTFNCDSYKPNNPLMKYLNQREEADTISTMDLIVQQQSIADQLKQLKK